MSGVNPASEQALQDALLRLSDGRPLRSSGSLTVTGLAAEAGVSRSTANRSTAAVDALRALRLRRESPVESERPLFDERQARKELTDLRRRHAEKVAALETSIDILAQHVQVLTLDNERLRKALPRPGSNVAAHRSAKGGA